MANYNVTQRKGEENWRVVKDKATRASAITGTQKEAEKIAKNLSSKNGGGEVRIHKPNGGPIRDSDTVSPGHDPYPPKDKKN